MELLASACTYHGYICTLWHQDMELASAYSYCICYVIYIYIYAKEISVRIDSRVFLIAIFIAGTLLRFAPLLLDWEYTCINDLSDTGTHYYGALDLATTGALGGNIVTYEKIFPYMFPYTFFLSLFVRLCGDIRIAILFSNTLLDYASIFLIYVILKKITNQSCAIIGVILSVLNPFAIAQCWFSMNLMLVNFLLVLSVHLALKVLSSDRCKTQIIYSGILGIFICLANYIRPVFTVVLIATSILLVLRIIQEKSLKQILVVALMILAMVVPKYFINTSVNSYLGEDVMNSQGGWSFYIGSNYVSYGQWSASDRDYFFGEITPYNSSSDARNIIMQKAIERYKGYTPSMFIEHIANKFFVLFGKQDTAMYDIEYCLGKTPASRTYKILSSLISLYFAMLAFASVYSHVSLQEGESFVAFLRLLLLGFTAAFLLVEVMNRYTHIMYPILVMIAAVGVGRRMRHM